MHGGRSDLLTRRLLVTVVTPARASFPQLLGLAGIHEAVTGR